MVVCAHWCVKVCIDFTIRSLFGEKTRTSTNSNLEPRAEKKGYNGGSRNASGHVKFGDILKLFAQHT